MTLSSRIWASGVSVASGVAMALLPKCPACVAAYFGFLSAVGLDQWAPSHLWPLTYALFGASIVFLGVRAWHGAFYKPFVLALAGAVLLVFARVLELQSGLLWMGCGMFLLGAVWSARRSRVANIAPCHVADAAASAIP
jgi:hypothetical protein